ncbi:MAG: hypothetical protein V2A77_00380 [Pseudomonadota bacterium]
MPLLALLAAVAGCGGPRYYRLPIDLDQIKSVAVLPLQNLTSDQTAADKVRRVLVAELLAQGKLDVIESGLVDRTVYRNTASRYALTPEEVQAVGQELGVRALITGSVSSYGLSRSGGSLEAPEVAVELFMLDCETASVIWSAAEARNGLTFGVRNFGTEPLRLSDQAGAVIHSMAATLSAPATKQATVVDFRTAARRRKQEEAAAAKGNREKYLGDVQAAVSDGLAQQVTQGVLRIKRLDDRVSMLFAMDVFFDYGKTEVSSEGEAVARNLAAIVNEKAGGMTMEVIIYPEAGALTEEASARYASVWDLTAARVATLLRQIEKNGVDSSRLKGSCYSAQKTESGLADKAEMLIVLPQTGTVKVPLDTTEGD